MKRVATTKSKASKTQTKPKAGVTHLSMNLHRQFFDEIAAGTKTKEYRDNTDYWRRRLEGRSYKEIHFRNGYATKAPFMRVEFKGVREVGSESDGQFVIRLGKVLELKNYLKRRA